MSAWTGQLRGKHLLHKMPLKGIAFDYRPGIICANLSLRMGDSDSLKKSCFERAVYQGQAVAIIQVKGTSA